MYPEFVQKHYQSQHGAIVFPNHTRVVGDKLYVRYGDGYFQTKPRHNGAYPINYEVKKGHPEFEKVNAAFSVPLYEVDTPLKKAA